MAWIESHQSLRNHRKTGRLARKLNISKVTAIGHLHCLWWWCMDNAPSGTLVGIDAEDIADGAEWEGDPADFLAALEYSGFIEGQEVHDWYDYAGKLIEKRQKDAERKRESRRREDDPPPSPVRNRDVRQTSTGHPKDGAGTVPNPTVPNLTTPPPTPPPGDLRAVPANVTPISKTRRDEVWDALVEGTGISPQTNGERQRFGKSVAELLALDATRPEILQRCASYRKHYPNAALTDRALVNNWSSVAASRASPNGKVSQADINSGKRNKYVD